MKCYLRFFLLVGLLQPINSLSNVSRLAMGHEQTREQFKASRQVALAKSRENSEQVDETTGATAALTVELWDEQGKNLIPGLVQVTNVDTDKTIELEGQIHRERNWYSVPAKVKLKVPRAKLRVDAFHGIETELVSQTTDLTERIEATLQFRLPRIYDPQAQGIVSGNTHLHLRKMSYDAAMRYLKLVPKSDGLDMVFLSHLRRLPDERTYISNLIVENSFNGGDLARLSRHGVLFGNGEEHRHNFESNSEGYGHVMLLNLKQLIRPISIGPGIMRSGTDGRPMQRGIRAARSDGATIIWCHGQYGLEDVPNWVEGLLDAQNVFDGGSSSSYERSFYKYLNLGLKVPFSTGTDWFIYDFSRVYIPIQGEVTTDQWLQQLSAGRSYITNGTFLEFQVDDHPIGDTISLEAPTSLRIKGRAVGRLDFGSLELIFNGKVAHSVESQKSAGHFVAGIDFDFQAREPGWLALAIPRHVARNELDKELFAHTSPIYLELAGKQVFHPAVAQSLLEEIEQNLGKISFGGSFDPGEEESVLKVHRQGLARLQKMLKEHQRDE